MTKITRQKWSVDQAVMASIFKKDKKQILGREFRLPYHSRIAKGNCKHNLGCHRAINVVLPQMIASEVLLTCGIRSAQTNKPFQTAGGKQLSGTKVPTQRVCKGFKSTTNTSETKQETCITPPLIDADFLAQELFSLPPRRWTMELSNFLIQY